MNERDWPGGYYIDPQNYWGNEGPAPTPGNMRVLSELCNSLKLEIDRLKTILLELKNEQAN